MLEQINYAVGVAPLVVVPRDNLEEPLLTRQVVLGGGKGVIDGGIAVVNEVGRHKVLSAAAKMGFSKWCFSVGPGGAHTGPHGPHAKTPCTKAHLSSSRELCGIASFVHYYIFSRA